MRSKLGCIRPAEFVDIFASNNKMFVEKMMPPRIRKTDLAMMTNTEGWTACHFAAFVDSTDMMTLALPPVPGIQHIGQSNNKQNLTPMDVATTMRSPTVIQNIVTLSKKHRIEEEVLSLDHHTADGWDPIELIILHGTGAQCIKDIITANEQRITHINNHRDCKYRPRNERSHATHQTGKNMKLQKQTYQSIEIHSYMELCIETNTTKAWECLKELHECMPIKCNRNQMAEDATKRILERAEATMTRKDK